MVETIKTYKHEISLNVEKTKLIEEKIYPE